MFFLLLLIASLMIQVYSIYSYMRVEERNRWQYYCYKVEPLDYEPEKYWNLTDPDPYILEAIQHLGEWAEPFYWEDSTFWFTAIWEENPEVPGPRPAHAVPFKYNGTYYDYSRTVPGTRLRATLLNDVPEEYWNLTYPEKYLLEAIENPGETVVVGINSGVNEILGPYLWPSTYKPFKYNGRYYEFSVYEIDYGYPLPKPQRPELTASILGLIWIAAGSIYFLENRKTKTQL